MTLRGSRVLVLLALLVMALGANGCPPILTPNPSTQAILTFGSEPLTIEGEWFGDFPRTGWDYLLKVKGEVGTIIDSHDPRIATWNDSLIVLTDPPVSEGSFDLFIVRWAEGGGEALVSHPVHVEVYEYTNYPMTVPPGDNAYPIDLEFGGDGTLWVTSEFSKSIYSLAPSGSSLVAHTIPQPTEYIFIFSGAPTHISGLSEDVVVDSSGDVWFTQGGGYLYEGSETNASRVVQYTPSTGASRCYNIPTNNAQIFGLYLDEPAGAIWVTAGGRFDGNFVARFLPGTFSASEASCLYDFVGSPPANYCGVGETDSCFARYDMVSPATNPTYFYEDPNGHLWISQFFGSSISELDPGTGVIVEYSMPEPSGTSRQASTWGSGPWSLVPGTAGRLWVLEGFDNQIVEFDLGAGEVLSEYTVPGFDPDYDFVHTLLPDGAGNMWFSMYTTPEDEGTGWLGRFGSYRKFEMFPPLPLLGITGGIAGLAIDPASGDICFAEFWEASIGCLSKVE